MFKLLQPFPLISLIEKKRKKKEKSCNQNIDRNAFS